MYIETSSPRVNNDNAIIGKQVSLTGNSCLKFYYNMLGKSVGTLNVRVGNTLVFTKSGNQGQAWKSAEVRLSQSGTHKVSPDLSPVVSLKNLPRPQRVKGKMKKRKGSREGEREEKTLLPSFPLSFAGVVIF